MAGAQNRERLVDAMLLVRFELLQPAFFDEFDNPARVEIHGRDETLRWYQKMVGSSV